MYIHNFLFVTWSLFISFSRARLLAPDHVLWGAPGIPSPINGSQLSSEELLTNDVALKDRDISCTNGPLTRSCWSNGFSVATDFDAKWPNTGKTVSVSHSTATYQADDEADSKKVQFGDHKLQL